MIVFIANQFVTDKIATGGDVLFIEMLIRASKDNRCVVIAPLFISNAIRSRAPLVEFVSSDDNKSFKGTASNMLGGAKTVISYTKRSFFTYRWLYNKKDAAKIYLTGDFFCNTIPVYFSARNFENIYSNFFHRNPKPINRPGNLFIVSLISRFLQSISLKLIKSFSSTTFVLTEIGKKELVSEGFDKGKIIISGAGVDKRLSNYQAVDKNQNQIIFVGRLNITKGIYDLLEILSSLDKSGANFICYLVGSISSYDKKSIDEIIRDNKLVSKIKILGYVSEEEKIELIATSKVLAFPSKEEGYGITVQEALNLGTSVVCYNLPVLKLLFSPSDLISYAKYGDKEDFADKIANFLSSKKSYSLNKVFLRTWDDVYETQFKKKVLTD
jgi:glycosyltransferase involved in cell wall biosynthesis